MRSQTRIAQQGLTLVELLVTLVLAGLISIAAATLFSVATSSYRTVDAGQELQDNGRFALEVIGQAARLAGYQNYTQRNGSGDDNSRQMVTTSFPTVRGYNNAKTSATGTNDGDGVTDNGGYNNSDTLAFRFHGSSKLDDPITADGSMIDCLGFAQNYPANADDVALSLFSISVDASGEPALQCTSRGNPSAAVLVRQTQPLIKGMESLQVMYGLDTTGDNIIDKWVSGQSVANWLQVSAVRVGFIIRGPVGSLQAQSATASDNKLYPLGKEFTGTSTETGLVYVSPNDGRLRRAYSATYKLRNPQE